MFVTPSEFPPVQPLPLPSHWAAADDAAGPGDQQDGGPHHPVQDGPHHPEVQDGNHHPPVSGHSHGHPGHSTAAAAE